MRSPFTWHTPFTEWDMPVATALVLLLLAICYAAGIMRLRSWRIRDAAAFYAGLLVCALAVGGGIGAYSTTLFTVHMAQHLLLIMVVPTLILLGRPLELLRRTGPQRLRRALGRANRSRAGRVLTHPLLGFLYYAVVVAGTHLTPFQQSAATNPALHGVEILLYLSSGYLFLLPIVGSEPAGRRLAPLLRMVTLLVGMVVDTVVGVTLLMTVHPPFAAYVVPDRGWGPDALTDLHWGGAMMWVGGDLLMALLAIVVIAAWVSGSNGKTDLGTWLESARRSALTEHTGSLDATVDLDDDEEALRAYNAMLTRMANTEQQPPNHPR
ncbi:cytochrome c oxidase assembly protein [Amycolatopsis sp. FU40]|uniref:cytochrome c oxidase assembly protein n=1 Tax=Amycolatopsis sp. FU40 TaxID=2914159 RepID=UPI001F1C264A|nr:cytochrome c oxidase assembly protein [Amycolatopsis sp. FU40]UKD58022.1 cytochrome c oxidase assembly protein [Amycolatopsis sp. FU40]